MSELSFHVNTDAIHQHISFGNNFDDTVFVIIDRGVRFFNTE